MNQALEFLSTGKLLTFKSEIVVVATFNKIDYLALAVQAIQFVLHRRSSQDKEP